MKTHWRDLSAEAQRLLVNIIEAGSVQIISLDGAAGDAEGELLDVDLISNPDQDWYYPTAEGERVYSERKDAQP